MHDGQSEGVKAMAAVASLLGARGTRWNPRPVRQYQCQMKIGPKKPTDGEIKAAVRLIFSEPANKKSLKAL